MTGWSIGQNGTIVHTTNGGATWEAQESGTTAELHCVYFVDSQVGWVVGDKVILHTSDGGENWDLQSTTTANAVYFFDSLTGWAVGPSGAILHTVDGGAVWELQISGTSVPLNSLYFTDNMTGWAVGYNGTIIHTANGGSTWEQQVSGTANEIIDLYFADSLNGLCADFSGSILRTLDGGITWLPQQYIGGALYGLNAIHFVDNQTGWALGYGAYTDLLYHTSDGGKTWEVQSTSALEDVCFIDNQTGWAVGWWGIMLHTSNGGVSWYDETPKGISSIYSKVYFTDNQTGWVVVTDTGGTILHTLNGGMSWETQSLGIGKSISDIYFTNNVTGWAIAAPGRIFHTDNGGADWQLQSSGISNWLFDIFFIDSLAGWAVGDSGTILHTANGGADWQQQPSGTSYMLLNVHFINKLTGWAVGGSGTILHTDDGGLNWHPQVSGTGSSFKGVHFTDSNRGWIFDDNSILHTSNGGKNWYIQFQSEQLYVGWEFFTAMDFADSLTGCVVGGNAAFGGTILKITPDCASYSNTLSGTLFREDQANCHYDSTEQPLSRWLVKAERDSQAFYAVADTAGRFSMLVDTGVYALSARLPNALWVPCDTIQVHFDQVNQSVDTPIGMQAAYLCPMLNVDIATPFLRRCFDNNYYVSWCNEGTAVAENAYVELSFDPDLVVDTSTLPDLWTNPSGNQFRVELGTVQPGACGSFPVSVAVPCNAVLGSNKCVSAHIYPDSICFPTPGWDGSNLAVTATCKGDTVFFTIQNIGTGDMTYIAEYIIIENVVLRPGDDFQLQAGADTIVIVADANNQTWRLEVSQHPANPYSHIASVTAEGCPDATAFSFFLQYPQEEASPFMASDCRPIIGSWDPNNKSASPEGLGDEHTIRDNTPLEYLIHFQNTGTDTAFQVVVRDTLSPFLDLASVQPGTSSHPYRFEVMSGNVLKFTFDNIALPDSNVNEPASHGFVQFSILQKSVPANPPGTRIENRAAIYFDYNASVLTNMVFHNVAVPDISIFRDTICKPDGPNMLSADTVQYSYFEVIQEVFESDILYATLDTAVCKGDTVFNAVILGPVQIIEHLNSLNGCDSMLTVNIDTLPAGLCNITSTKASADLPFLLFPNPTSGDLTLLFLQSMQEHFVAIEIYDMTGRLQQMVWPLSYGANGTVLRLPVSGLPRRSIFHHAA